MRSLRTLFVFQDMLIVLMICVMALYDLNVIGASFLGLFYLFIVIARECLVHDYKI